MSAQAARHKRSARDRQSARRERSVRGATRWLWFALACAALGCDASPEGAAPVPYDRVACAQCRMLVGEPRFAAQALSAAGERRYFDDPGCLLLHLDANAAEGWQSWLRHVREERWLPLSEAGFVRAGPSPMDYGLGAVARTEPGALSPQQALQHTRARYAPSANARKNETPAATSTHDAHGAHSVQHAREGATRALDAHTHDAHTTQRAREDAAHTHDADAGERARE